MILEIASDPRKSLSYTTYRNDWRIERIYDDWYGLCEAHGPDCDCCTSRRDCEDFTDAFEHHLKNGCLLKCHDFIYWYYRLGKVILARQYNAD